MRPRDFGAPANPARPTRWRTTVEFFERGIITTVNSPPVATALCSSQPAHCRRRNHGGRVGGRGDGHGQMTKATPYQSRGQPRTPVRLVNECPQRRMEVGRDGGRDSGRDSGREGTSPIKWRDWHGRAAALPQTALGCVIDGGRWRRGRPRPANVGETDDAGAAASLPLIIESLQGGNSEISAS